MQNTTKNTKTLRFVDLFAGIGGFRLGLEKINYGLESVGSEETRNERVGDTIKARDGSKHKDSGGKSRRGVYTCVYSNEWDKYASQIYKKHYGECDTTDITKVNAKDIPDHDLLCAGFPCQSFSIAGKRRGFEDTRGTLFFDIARILSEKRPRLVLLENVKGLLSHDKGKTFQTILGVLSDLGYRTEWQVLNSKHFGVPQNRERVFIVGHLGGFGRRKVFPIGKSNKAHPEEITQEVSDAQRIYKPKIAKTLKGLGGGLGAKTGLYAIRRSGDLGKQKTSLKDEMGALASNPSSDHVSRVTDGVRIRRLTPIECARLQGFPDDWCEDLSNTQAYKCYGNAVTTNVITAIGRKLYEL